MIVFKCDRCRKDCETIIRDDRYNGIEARHKITLEELGCTRQYELCEECFRKVRAFMTGLTELDPQQQEPAHETEAEATRKCFKCRFYTISGKCFRERKEVDPEGVCEHFATR